MKKIPYFILMLTLLSPLLTQAQLDVFTPLFQQNPQDEQNDFQLDLVWKAHTNVPPFYNGKPLPVTGSVVSVIALTPTQNAGGLTFFWQADGVLLGSQGTELEGRGEDVFAFVTNPLIRRSSYNISVVAQNLTTGQTARASVSIPIQEPQANIYIMRETMGLFPRAIERFETPPGRDFTLLAAPYYFLDDSGQLSFSWFFGGRPVYGAGSPPLLELSIPSTSGPGSQDARVTITGQSPGSTAQESVRITVQP